MFDNNINSEYILGYAFEVEETKIITYKIIKKDNIKFVFDEFYNYNKIQIRDSIICALMQKGYRSLDY